MNRYLLASMWMIITVILDQISKIWVSNVMDVWTGKQVIPGFFNLVHVVNKGAAWGFLDNEDIDWQRPLFIIITFIALGFIAYMLKNTDETDTWMITGLALIAGGAIGNLIDRVRLGVVIDFLDFHFGNYHWPAFNVADCALTIGAGCIILSMFLNRKSEINKTA